MTTGRILNIPNILTLARIALIPVFLLVAYWPPIIGAAEQDSNMTRHMILTAIFVVAAITDWFDGYLARSLNQTSAFGRFLDPVADKFMIGTAMVSLSILGRLPWWMTIVILSREIGITLFRLAVIKRGVIPANRGGKIKAMMQGFGVGFYVLPLDESLYWFRDGFMYIAIALTIFTGAYYVKSALTHKS